MTLHAELDDDLELAPLCPVGADGLPVRPKAPASGPAPKEALPVTVHSGLTWPKPGETFEYVADATHTGKKVSLSLPLKLCWCVVF